MFFPAIAPQNARKGSPQARVRMGVMRQSVGTDHCGRIGENAPHVVFIDLEIDRARRSEANCSIGLRDIPFGGDVGEILARHFRVRRGPGDHDPDGLIHHMRLQNGRACGVGIGIE